MLAYLLALGVGLGSLALYMAAFFFPEVHRKNDFIWSGVGMFYALVLWVSAERITGGILLGQAACVALLGWLGWQTLNLRRQVTPMDQQTPLPSSEDLQETLANLSKPETIAKLTEQAKPQFEKLKGWVQALLETATKSKNQPQAEKKSEEPYVPLTPADFSSAGLEVEGTTAESAIAQTPQASETPQAPAKPVETEAASWVTVTEEAPESIEAVAKTVAKALDQVSDDLADAPEDMIPKAAKGAGSAFSEISGKATTLVATLTDVVKGFFKKPESKTTYVRKQYRDSDETESDDEFIEEDEFANDELSAQAEVAIEAESVIPEVAVIETIAAEVETIEMPVVEESILSSDPAEAVSSPETLESPFDQSAVAEASLIESEIEELPFPEADEAPEALVEVAEVTISETVIIKETVEAGVDQAAELFVKEISLSQPEFVDEISFDQAIGEAIAENDLALPQDADTLSEAEEPELTTNASDLPEAASSTAEATQPASSPDPTELEKPHSGDSEHS
jgi:hypothetical protein